MFDAKRLLDQFMGAPQGGGFDPRGENDNRGRDFGGQRGGDLMQQASGALGGIFDGRYGGFGGGALAGGLAGLLLGGKGTRKLAGSALTHGGMAVAGALAYRAYQNWQQGKAATPASSSVPLLPPPSNTPFNPASEAEQQTLGQHLLRAMIAAAKADGHIDHKEQQNIFVQMDRMNVSAGDKAFVMDELRKPLDVDAVARAAQSPEEAAEIYTVSLLAIDVDNPAERGYLAMLAARLKLDEKLVEHLHATVEGVTETVPVKA
jgi:uncharacterized membrane protein YebE (DUF533 family)